MDEATINELGRATLLTALIIVAPALLVGMFTGLAASLFQTVTGLQEQTLAIVPKMIMVVATLLLLMPWIIRTLVEFAQSLFSGLAAYTPNGF